jgi:hypothetical protein
MRFIKHSSTNTNNLIRGIAIKDDIIYTSGEKLIAYYYDEETNSITSASSIDLSSNGNKFCLDDNYIYTPLLEYGLSACSFDGTDLTSIAVVETDDDYNRCTATDNSYIYLGTNTGIKSYTFDGNSFTYITSADFGDVVDIKVSKNNNIFIASSTGLFVTTFDGGSFTQVSSADGNFSFVDIGEYDGLFTKEYIYGAKQTLGICSYTFDGSTLSSAAAFDDAAGISSHNVCIADGRVLWVGGSNSNFFGYTFDGSSFVKEYTDIASTCSCAVLYNKKIFTSINSYFLNIYQFDSSIYTDLATDVSGVSTSASPYTSNQLDLYTNNTYVISAGVSACSDEDYIIRGNGISQYGTTFITKFGSNFISWIDGSPWQITAASDLSYMTFGIKTDDLGSPTKTFSADNVVNVENAILADCSLKSASTEYATSGTFNFRTCIIYDDLLALSQKQWNSNFYGCSIISADITFSEYSNDITTYLSNNVAEFNDCLFINCNFYDLNKNYGSLIFNNCLFTNDSSATIVETISATDTSGTVEFNDCTFDFIPARAFPSYNNIITGISNNDLYSISYNIPITSADRLSAWEENDNTTGFWESTRSGVGAFNFFENTTGHIGAFYFGSDIGNVSVVLTSGASLSIIPNTIQVVEGNSITTNLQSPARLVLFAIQPNVNISELVYVDFTGTPLIETSPFIVNFTANIDTSIYRVTEYRWYFDVDNYPDEYETSTNNTISHTFDGIIGQSFSIACVAVVTPIN